MIGFLHVSETGETPEIGLDIKGCKDRRQLKSTYSSQQKIANFT